MENLKTRKKASSSTPILIVGGGWAGLAAAIQLVDHGLAVTLIEAAPQLGGRARMIFFSDQKVDNGQHLMIGAYHRVQSLVKKINPSKNVLLSTPLQLNIQSTHTKINFKLPQFHFPFNILLGILKTYHLTLSERLALLYFCIKLQKNKFKIKTDISVSDFLKSHNLPQKLIYHFFEPLCLAALSTPAAYASAEVFITVLKDSFASHFKNTNLLFATTDLSALFPTPAYHYIKEKGGEILTHTRAQALIIENGHLEGIVTQSGTIKSKHIILATAFQSTKNLLNKHESLKSLHHKLEQINNEIITTIYLQYDKNISLECPMVGLIGTWSQWVFDRRFANQPGLFAIVITGTGPHTEIDNQSLITHIETELNTHFSHVPQHANTGRVIREKHAAFSCSVGINTLRPELQTELPGLWLAGDYTQTGYPASLEGAVKSGQQCAEQLLNNYQRC